MNTWISRCRAKYLAQKQERKNEIERLRILHEEQLERCKEGKHEWETTYEVQGDGDPNVEGYIMITRTTCRICHESDTTIEPYEKGDGDMDD